MLVRLLYFAWIATGLCTLFGFLSDFGWLFNLCSHFRIQYLAIALICAIILLIKKDFRAVAICILLVMANAWEVYPQMTAKHKSSDRKDVRIVQMNVFVGNRNFQAIDSFIKSAHADVVGIEEFNDAIAHGVAALGALDAYPYQIRVHNSGSQSDIALFSKIPFKSQTVKYSPAGKDPTIVANIERAGKVWTIVLMHPRPPGLPQLLKRQEEQFDRVASTGAEFGPYLIVLGDLNTSPWAAPFRRLLSKLDLTDARSGHGVSATWPSTFLPLLLPIDYVLVGHNVDVSHFEVGPYTGSDHYPLIVDVFSK